MASLNIGSILRTLPNVQQVTIKPIITAAVAQGSLIYSDEYDIYGRVPEWTGQHSSVCHSEGEYARDENSDGFCEIHVNTMEGFQFIHNVRKRGKQLLSELIGAVVA